MAFRPAAKSAVAFAAGPVLAVVALKCAARCALRGTLAEVWPSIVATQGS